MKKYTTLKASLDRIVDVLVEEQQTYTITLPSAAVAGIALLAKEKLEREGQTKEVDTALSIVAGILRQID